MIHQTLTFSPLSPLSPFRNKKYKHVEGITQHLSLQLHKNIDLEINKISKMSVESINRYECT